jgi:hypothetical protein
MGVSAGSLSGVLGGFGKILNMQFLALFGLLLSVLILLGFTYLSVRRFRPHMSADAFKRLYGRKLMNTAGWAVGTYLIAFILLVPVIDLILHNMHVKGF